MEHYFNDPLLTTAAPSNDSREAKLTHALDAHVALRIQAERLIAAYVAPESNRAVVIDELITLFDGPQQREAQKLAWGALDKAREREGWHFL